MEGVKATKKSPKQHRTSPSNQRRSYTQATGRPKHQVATPPTDSKAQVSPTSSSGPYDSGLEGVPATPILPESFSEVLRQLPKPPASAPAGRVIKRFQVNKEHLGIRAKELEQLGIVLFTPGISPERKEMEKWANLELAPLLGVFIQQIRLLSQSTFLLVLDRSQSRQLVLDSTPIFFGSCMVLVQPYSTAIDISSLQYKCTAIWVELVSVHPILEIEAQGMLEEVGPVLHSTIKTDR